MLVGSQNLLQQSQNKRTSLLDILTSKNDHRENEKYVQNYIYETTTLHWGHWGQTMRTIISIYRKFKIHFFPS